MGNFTIETTNNPKPLLTENKPSRPKKAKLNGEQQPLAETDPKLQLTGKNPLELALHYATVLGYPVFPVRSKAAGFKDQYKPKSPHVSGGYKAAVTDERQIKAWWRKWPTAAIGIPTGIETGLLVLDADIKGDKDGPKRLEEFAEEGKTLPPTLTVQTPSGGFHYWFKYPEEAVVSSKSDKPAPGLDYRGNGGLIIAPGSIVEGKRYEIISGSFGDFADPPSWWVNSIQGQPKTKKKRKTKARTQSQENKLPEAEISRIKDALSYIDASPYDGWLEVGMALHSTQSEQAFALWDEWSKTADNFDPETLQAKWESFDSSGDITLATLFYKAREAGWIDPQDSGLPAGFRVTSKGLYLIEEDRPPLWICSPLLVTARTRDAEQNTHGRLLEFRDLDGHLHSWAMPMEMLAGDGEQLRRELFHQGLLVGEERKERKALMVYLRKSKPTSVARCVTKTGWFKDCFVLPEETLGQTQERVLFQAEALARNPYTTQGSLAQWQNHVAALCVGNSRPTVAVSVAFAAPLLTPLQLEGGGFHFKGYSSRGKTCTVKTACSVWGDSTYLQRWRATVNGLESVAALHNDALLGLDEIEEASPRDVGAAAYMLSHGSGKARASRTGGSRPRTTWKTLFLSSGEKGLPAHARQGGARTTAGQEIRVCGVPGEVGRYGVFETIHHRRNSQVFAEELEQNSLSYYGTAARAYLKRLVEEDPVKLRRMFKISTQKFFKEAVPEGASGQVSRAANRFSLVAFGGELATQYGITGWNEGEAFKATVTCFNDWLKDRGTFGNLEEQNLLQQVKLFFELHGESRFSPFDPTSDYPTKTQNRVGYRRNFYPDDDQYLVFPECFREEICKGYNYREAAKILLKHGFLEPDREGKSSQSIRDPKERQKRFYVFNSSKLEGRVK